MHWHAVQLDIRHMFGCHKRDMFTARLQLDEVIALCVANYPGTATYYAINNGWTTADHLLATMVEQDAGLIRIASRAPRPGITDTPGPKKAPAPLRKEAGIQRISFTAMPLSEFVTKFPNQSRKGY
jgi:hypothetical protein